MLQLGIFVAVTAASLTLLRVLSGAWPGRSRLRRRLAAEFSAGTQSAPSPLYKNLDTLDDLAGEDALPGEREALGRRIGWRERGEELLRQAGVPLGVRQFFWLVTGSAVAAGLVGLLAVGWLVGGAGAIAGAVAPLVVVAVKRRARRERYLKQLVGAFELMARVLRAGQSVSEAFRASVEAFEEPLAGEFGRCLHQIEHGIRPEEAFRELSRRSGILELRIFVVAMTIQRQTGGNLSEVLDRLATVVRTRLQLRQKIRALTAEGRLQSLTLTILPVLTFGVMYAINRQYAEALLTQWRLLAATVVCMAVGVVWIRNIMNFEG
jgi:tight adherence protein B